MYLSQLKFKGVEVWSPAPVAGSPEAAILVRLEERVEFHVLRLHAWVARP